MTVSQQRLRGRSEKRIEHLLRLDRVNIDADFNVVDRRSQHQFCLQEKTKIFVQLATVRHTVSSTKHV